MTSIFLFAPMGLGSRRPRRLEKTQKSTFVPRHVLLFLERCTSSKKTSPNQAKAYFISYNHKNLRNCNFFGFGFFSLILLNFVCHWNRSPANYLGFLVTWETTASVLWVVHEASTNKINHRQRLRLRPKRTARDAKQPREPCAMTTAAWPCGLVAGEV